MTKIETPKKTSSKKAAALKTATKSAVKTGVKSTSKVAAKEAVKKVATKAAPPPVIKIPAKKAATKAPVKASTRKTGKTNASASSEAFVEAQLKLITATLEDNKAEDMLVIDLRGRSALADYFVVASGRSSRQVGALGDYIDKALAEAGQTLKRREGVPANDWVLLDTGDIIVHLFRPEVREYYQLEKLWSPDQRKD